MAGIRGQVTVTDVPQTVTIEGYFATIILQHIAGSEVWCASDGGTAVEGQGFSVSSAFPRYVANGQGGRAVFMYPLSVVCATGQSAVLNYVSVASVVPQQTYDLLLPELALRVPQCPEPQLIRELRWAGREFCRLTGLWREPLNVINLVAGQPEYELVHGYEAEIERLAEVWTDGNPRGVEQWEVVFETPAIRFRRGCLNWNSTDIADFDAGATYAKGATVDWLGKFWEADVANGPAAWDVTKWREVDLGLRVVAIMRPMQNANGLPLYFFDRYADELVLGAQARLYAQRGVPWSSPQEARLLHDEFKHECGIAAMDVVHKHGAQVLTAQFPKFC